jgi:hypothetical protein
VGALITIPVLAIFGGERAVIVAASVGAIAGLLFSTLELQRSTRFKRKWAAGVLLAAFLIASLIALVSRPGYLAQRLSPYKTLSVLLQTIDAHHALSDWDSSARVDVVESDTIHIMPGLSLLSPATIPPQIGLMLDGDSLMPITGLDPDSEQARQLADYTPQSLAFHLRPGGKTVVIEAGTGMDVLFPLAAGASQVAVVEENGLVLDIVENEYEEFTFGLYSDPRVTLFNKSGRVFARQQGQANNDGVGIFDVVIVALTEPHRPVTSGAYSLTENYLYTVEAFQDYLDLLEDDGLLVVTRWLQAPPSESGRTLAILNEALQAMNLDPAEHVIAYRTLRTITFISSLHPFSSEELEITRNFLRQRNYDPVYLYDIQPEELNRYNILEAPLYHDLFADILADPEAVYADYRFDIRPPTDDRPFFYHYFKWRQTPEILAALGYNWQPFGGSGFFVLVALLIVVVLASAVLIIGPLLLRRKTRSFDRAIKIPFWRARVFVYFATLGLAFLFVEIPLAQRFILVLDQPVTALAAVLFAILLFSGLGSLSSRRWPLFWGFVALIALIALYPILLKPLSSLALGMPEGGRIFVAVAAIAPLGFLMGLPFAGGLRVVESYESGLVPWAWAINGTFSVISSVLAVMIALSWGFSAVLWLGAAAYGVALLTFRKWLTSA